MSVSATSHLRPFDVLVVDDDAGDVLLIQDALADRKLARQLHVAGDGLAALEFLRDPQRPRPHLMLLDLNMPVMGGRELLGQVKSDPVLRSIPIVVLSTSVTDEDVLVSYELRANAYVAKPLDLDEFIATIHQIDDFYLGIVQLPSAAARP